MYFIFSMTYRTNFVVVSPPEVRCKERVVAADYAEVLGQVLHRAVVPHADVGVGRGDGGHVRPVVHNRDHIVAVFEDIEELLRDIVWADAVLECQVELVCVVHITPVLHHTSIQEAVKRQ